MWSLRESHKSANRVAQVVIAGGLTTPRRAEGCRNTIDHTDYRAIVIKQGCTLDMLPPKAGVGTLSGARFAKAENGKTILLKYRGVDGNSPERYGAPNLMQPLR